MKIIIFEVAYSEFSVFYTADLLFISLSAEKPNFPENSDVFQIL